MLTMSYNYHIAQGLILPFAFGLGSCSNTGKNSPEHPNILVIMTDQQSASMMSCAGNRWITTPAMDGIASQGIRFTRAYAANPVSSPSRFSMQTGRYSSEIGMRENERVGVAKERVIGLYANALGNVFRKGGYQTYYGGKVHMPVTGNDVQIIGYELLSTDEREGLAGDCADFLLKRRKEDKPFLLFASFINPHDICFQAIRYGSPGDDLARATPPELDEALKLPEGISEQVFFNKYCPPLPDNHQPMIGEPSGVDSLLHLRQFRETVRERWTEKDWRMHRWAYLKLTERVDAQIGIVMEALKRSGLSENTVVIFTSDHGDQDGSHKLEHKTVFYEESANIPFIVSYPWMKQKGVVDNEHIINNGMSLLPTMCDIAGIEPPPGLTGSSVLPVIRHDRNVRWPGSIFLENESGYLIHTGRFKYELDDGGKIREMFVDLKTDPGETVNLINNAAYTPVIDSLRTELINHLTETGIHMSIPVN
jgi:arylsulfatase A-like enzyme